MVSQLFCSSDFLANSFSKINRRQRLIEVLEEALLQFRGEVDGYEDDTKKISILDPNLMLEAGWQKALSYLRKINETRSHTHDHASTQVAHSESFVRSQPLRQLQETWAPLGRAFCRIVLRCF